jgi:histone H3/H4
MSHDSSPKSPDAPSASLVDNDRYDELDANIRNFAPVARIMKNALPENAKIAKEAKECMQECVSEFISFITSEGMFCCPLAGSRLRIGPRFLTFRSLREVPPGEEEDRQWRGHSLRHDFPGFRELLGSAQDLPDQVQRGTLLLNTKGFSADGA